MVTGNTLPTSAIWLTVVPLSKLVYCLCMLMLSPLLYHHISHIPVYFFNCLYLPPYKTGYSNFCYGMVSILLYIVDNNICGYKRSTFKIF